METLFSVLVSDEEFGFWKTQSEAENYARPYWPHAVIVEYRMHLAETREITDAEYNQWLETARGGPAQHDERH
jgi:hypothetical protein